MKPMFFRASSFPIDMHQGILCLSQYVRHFDLAPLDYPFKNKNSKINRNRKKTFYPS